MRGKIGKKGEIYIPKEVREMINLNPGDEVLVDVKGKELIIRKKESVIDVLTEEAVCKVSVEELREIRKKLSELMRA